MGGEENAGELRILHPGLQPGGSVAGWSIGTVTKSAWAVSRCTSYTPGQVLKFHWLRDPEHGGSADFDPLSKGDVPAQQAITRPAPRRLATRPDPKAASRK